MDIGTHKLKKPSDPTIAEKFNTYRFADYKEKVMEEVDRVGVVWSDSRNCASLSR